MKLAVGFVALKKPSPTPIQEEGVKEQLLRLLSWLLQASSRRRPGRYPPIEASSGSAFIYKSDRGIATLYILAGLLPGSTINWTLSTFGRILSVSKSSTLFSNILLQDYTSN